MATFPQPTQSDEAQPLTCSMMFARPLPLGAGHPLLMIYSARAAERFIVITFNSGALAIGELMEQSAKAITVTSYTSGEERTRSMDEIKSYDVIVEISKPVKHRARRLQRA